jgi:hypothetical protein
MSRNKLYIPILVFCLGSLFWIKYNMPSSGHAPNVTVCLFKNVTGLPCPSCGSTRSVIALAEGDVKKSFFENPIGMLLASFILLGPPWIVWDYLSGKATFMHWYERAERFMRRRNVAIIMIGLVVANWIWNIIKGV